MTKFRESELLAKKVSGTLSPEEQAELEQWEQASETHRRLSEKVASPDFIRQAAENHKGEAMRSWEKMRRRLPRGRRSPYLRATVRRWTAIAASLALVAGIATLAYLHPWTTPTTLEPGTEKVVVRYAGGASEEVSRPLAQAKLADFRKQGRPTVIEVPRGGEYTLTLPDCTVVHLNAGSSLEIPADFSGGRRRVRLYGEAFFKVAHDARSPFDVQLPDSRIRVYGTEFNARQYDGEQPEVTLVEGQVGIRGTKEETRIAPGEQARTGKDGQISVQPVDTYLYIAWHEGRIAYDGERLDNIMEDLGRWYDFEASFSSDRLRGLRFTIDIGRRQTFNEIAEILRRMNKLDIRIKGKQVLISEI